MTYWSGVVTDKDTPIFTAPHYLHNMPYFDRERTTFGAKRDGLFYNYSDRLWEWDRDKMLTGGAAAHRSGYVEGSAHWHEVRLSYFHDKPVTLHHVIAGVNRSNGYSYAVFGYTFDERDE